MEKFTALGTFWLPGKHDAARAGSLVFDPGEKNTIVLRIADSFESGIAGFHPMTETAQTYPVVFGVLETGSQVTLTDLLKISASFKTQQVTASPVAMLAHWALMGGHFEGGMSTEFPDFVFDFDRLDEWALWMRPNLATMDEMSADGGTQLHLSGRAQTEFEAFGGHMSVNVGSSMTTNPNLFRAERSANMSYATDTPMTLNRFLEVVVTPLNHFLEFANGRPLRLTRLSGHFPPHDRQINENVIPTFIEAAFAGWEPPHDDEGLNIPILALTAMKGRESELLERWVELHESAKEAFGLSFSISSGPPALLETQFLLAIQGLEVMHRRILPGQAIDADELQRRIAVATGAAEDSDLKKWFEDKLRYAGEKSNRQRLREVLKLIGEPGHFIGQRFVDKAVVTRNFYTHYDKPSGTPEQGQALYSLTLQVLAAFHLFLFNQLGFNNDEARAIFGQSPLARTIQFQTSLASSD